MDLVPGRRDLFPSFLECHQTSPKNIEGYLFVEFSLHRSDELRLGIPFQGLSSYIYCQEFSLTSQYFPLFKLVMQSE